MTSDNKKAFIAALEKMFEGTGIQVKEKSTLGDSTTSIKVEFEFKNKFFNGLLSANIDALNELNSVIADLAKINLGFVPEKVQWNNTRDIMYFYKK